MMKRTYVVAFLAIAALFFFFANACASDALNAYNQYQQSYEQLKTAIANNDGEEKIKELSEICRQKYDYYKGLACKETLNEENKSANAETANESSGEKLEALRAKAAGELDAAGAELLISELETLTASGDAKIANDAKIELAKTLSRYKNDESRARILLSEVMNATGSGDQFNAASSTLKALNASSVSNVTERKKEALGQALLDAKKALDQSGEKYENIKWTSPFKKAAAKIEYFTALYKYNSTLDEYREFVKSCSREETKPLTIPQAEELKETARGCQPFVTGAFVQLAEGHNDEANYPLEYWMKELTSMKEIGMDLVIIQYTQYSNIDLFPAAERILTAADRLGMKAFVGTMLDESDRWYTTEKFSSEWLKDDSENVCAHAKKIVKTFGNHASLYGIYIPYEDNTLSRPDVVGGFYGSIVDAVKAERPDLLTLISPFTCLKPGIPKSFPSIVLEKYFKAMLAKARVDICAWQDGVGGNSEQLKKVDHDLAPIVRACASNGTIAWTNIEVFHRTTPISEDFAAEGTSFEIMKKQLDSQCGYVKKIICFDFNHYLSPNIGSESASKLYENYKEYYVNNKK